MNTELEFARIEPQHLVDVAVAPALVTYDTGDLVFRWGDAA